MKAQGLKRRLAIWLFGVLSVLLAVDAWFSYSDALGAANQAYDRSLSASVKGIAERVFATETEVVVDIPYSALELFEAGSSDRIFYSIGIPGEKAITGYEDLPMPGHISLNSPVFYDGHFKGQQLRLGAMLKPLYRAEFPKPVMVIIGETINTRQEVVQHLFLREVARKALLIIVALAVALFATIIAVKPIDNLGQAIRERPEDDLTPINALEVPHEVKPLVEAINLHMERIGAMLEARRRFITDAAHQLRTPLAVLNTQAEYALRQRSERESRPAIEALHRSLGSAIRLTNQLLSLSRAEPINGLMLARQAVDIAAVARDMVIELLPLAARRGIDLGFEGESAPLVVAGNPVLLRELIANLVDNALRYTPQNGVVSVAVDRAPQSAGLVRVRVIDNGPGIPAEFRDRVFLRFYRLDGGDFTGSGLGLSIVREIVQGHGGEIWLEDATPGLVVTVTLPLGKGLPADDPSENQIAKK